MREQTFTAQMGNSTGAWHVYVMVPGLGLWPDCQFEGASVPTQQERADALAVMGFEVLPDAEWRWVEDTQSPDDPTSPAVLIGAVDVRPAGGVA